MIQKIFTATVILAAQITTCCAGNQDDALNDPYIAFEYSVRTNFGLVVLKDPLGKPVKKQLTFDPLGQTNGMLVRIDGKDVEYGSTDGQFAQQGKADQNPSVTVWTAGKVQVTQTLEIKPGKSGKLDTLLARYDLENKDDRPHSVGIRVMVDSAIGSTQNDGVPFRYAGGAELITTCKDFPEGMVPEWVEALEKPDQKFPGTIAIMTLKVGGGLEAPSRARVTRWPGASPPEWEIPLESFGEGGASRDSCLVLYWMPAELLPGQRRSLGYGYGTQDVPSDALPSGANNAIGGSGSQPGMLRVTLAQEHRPELGPAVELVLDSSGSMKEPVEGQAKHLIARKVMLGLLDEMPDSLHVGLRMFGHGGFVDIGANNISEKDERWLTDSQLLVPQGPLDVNERRTRIKTTIGGAKPLGKTPLVYSLLEARKDFASDRRGPKIVVLVSDGKETCGGKLEDLARAYAEGNIDIVANIVGFDVTDGDRRQLEALAKAGNGVYYNARTANELSDAMAASMKIGFVVVDQEGQRVASGLVDGPAVPLPAGVYQVRLQGDDRTPRSVQIDSAQTKELVLHETG